MQVPIRTAHVPDPVAEPDTLQPSFPWELAAVSLAASDTVPGGCARKSLSFLL